MTLNYTIYILELKKDGVGGVGRQKTGCRDNQRATAIIHKKQPCLLTQSFFFNKFIYLFLFIYFWLCWVLVAAHGLFLVAASGGYSSLQCVGFSSQGLLLLQSTGSRLTSFSTCGTRAQQLRMAGSRVQAQQLWGTGLVAPQHVGSSQTRARTHVP